MSRGRQDAEEAAEAQAAEGAEEAGRVADAPIPAFQEGKMTDEPVQPEREPAPEPELAPALAPDGSRVRGNRPPG